MLSAVQQQPSGFFHDLFAPLPEESTSEPVSKDGLDRVSAYTDSTSGAWDFFRVVNQATGYFKEIPSLSDSARQLFLKGSEASNLSGISLSIPTIFSDLNTLRKKIGAFSEAQALPDDDPLRRQKVLQAGKGTFLSAMWLTNTVSQAGLFLHEAKVADLAQYVPAIDSVYQGSSLISDGAELVEQAYKLNSDRAMQWLTPTQIEEEKNLARIVIIKDLASVVLAVISLGGIALGIAVFSIQPIAWIGLGLSTVWLTAKISSYFYKGIIQERRTAPVLLPSVA